MAQAKLNFDEKNIPADVLPLYERLLTGMQSANSVDAPTIPSTTDMLVVDEKGNLVFDELGEPIFDQSKYNEIETASRSYAEIAMKNSAYLFANTIALVVKSANGGNDNEAIYNFILRDGDSMAGKLQALRGFEAGIDGNKIFEIAKTPSEENQAIIEGLLQVTKDADIKGELNISNSLSIGGTKVLIGDNKTLNIEQSDINLIGEVKIMGSFVAGEFVVDKDSVSYNGNEFYHAGNANLDSIDWSMRDAHISGQLNALYNFALGIDNVALLYPKITGPNTSVQKAYIVADSDLHFSENYGLIFNGRIVLSACNSQEISLSAPGMTLNLGHSVENMSTNKISLQSDLWDYTNTFKLISKEGAGYFANGLAAQASPSGSIVLRSYVNDVDYGIVFDHQIRFGSETGPSIKEDISSKGLVIKLPGFNENNGYSGEFCVCSTTIEPHLTGQIAVNAIHFTTNSDLFSFDKRIESESFVIKSDTYKTRLIEDVLFFDDDKFIEGVADGLRFSANGFFDNNVSSRNFASGFAGYGWAVKNEKTDGGYRATFDSLTVRKKLRVYEFEVQKNAVTNGSLWVSNSCSGDEVVKL